MDTSNEQRPAMPEGYNFSEIEANWQRVWDEQQTFCAADDDPRKKLYVLQMFPYPSGDLHAGHIRNYVIGDAVARYYKMQGYNVMHPMGFDSFGLPAEQAAIDRKIHPAQWIERCVETSRQQFRRYGFSFDWAREVVTSDPAYYKWTQWLFLKFFEMGLIYRKEIEVNWCLEHGVLANDEVKEGLCWRCDGAVGKKKMAQWIMRTTKYAKRLLNGIDDLPGWANAVRLMQRHWIGESHGTNITFKVPGIEGKTSADLKPELSVFTTRVDTIYGCTFMAIAPDHPLAQTVAEVGNASAELKQFAAECAQEENKYGLSDDKPKRGIYLGVDCINPFNGEPVQIWTTNYVVSDFGTGAVMAVPAHDTRDNAFAKEYGLPIAQVIAGEENDIKGGRSSVSALKSETGSTGTLEVSRHRLPHWEMEGATYFISWRLATKQPKLQPDARSVVMSALEHFHKERYELIACVVMDDHVHVLVKPHEGQELGKLLHSWRSFTANRLQREFGYEGKLWQDDYFDRIVRDEEEFNADLEYIQNNPFIRWPEISEYKWQFIGETSLEEIHTEPNSCSHGTKAPINDNPIDRAMRNTNFQRWFWIEADKHKDLIRDFEHGKEHFQDRRIAFQTWFGGGERPKLFRENAQVDGITQQGWATLLVGYLMLGRGVTKDFLAGKTGAFGFEVEIPKDMLLEISRADTEDRPPVSCKDLECYTEKGTCINSGDFDGMDFDTAKAAMDKWLEERGMGGNTVEYKLRDWNMGRQRFWGAPIPMVECEKCGWQPVANEQLPVELPDHADYSDVRVSPLANDEAWKAVNCPKCGGSAQRDTDTMTTFMCSAWYFLRFCDPHNAEAIFDPAKVAAWMPVDYYVGGKEHAVGHLLYSRFITQALSDAGLLSLKKPDHEKKLPDLTNEPYYRLFNQGIVYKDGKKMSKSKGNVVSSDELAERYGADTARLFSLFGGPADQDLEWSANSVEGCHRFLKRVWRFAAKIGNLSPDSPDNLDPAAEEAIRLRHCAVAGVSDDLTKWHFNTAVAKLMEYLNGLEAAWKTANDVDAGLSFHNALLTMSQLLSPFAPHFAEELWLQLGGIGLCCESEWPQYDPAMLIEDTIEIPVQVNGKVRGKITIATDASKQDLLDAAKADEGVAKWLEGKQLFKEIVIPGRMITLVVK